MADEKHYQVYKLRRPEHPEYPWVGACNHPDHKPLKLLFSSAPMAWKWIEVHDKLCFEHGSYRWQ